MKAGLGILIALLLIGGGFLLLTQENEPIPKPENTEIGEVNEQELQVYMNEQYGFSFVVPLDQDLYEYSPEFIALGATIPDGFLTEAEVVVAQSGEEGGYENFNAYSFDTARNMCAADGPTGTMYCEAIVNEESFTTDTGLSGTRFYLTRIQENFTTGARIEDEFGPFIAFNLQANVPDSDFSALIVRPPVSMAAYDAELVSEIARTLQIDLVQN